MTFVPRPSYRNIRLLEFDLDGVELNLSDNTNRWGAHPAALAALSGQQGEHLFEYPTPYADRLKEAVARRFGIAAECIATGCGSDDVLDSALRALGEPGERLVFVPPTFAMAEVLALTNGLEPVAVECPGDFPSAATLLATRPALVYLSRPNNPTGELVPRRVVEELLADPEGPVLLLDEAYAEFAGETLLPLAAESRRLLVLRTLSKAYGLAGLRVGYAVGDPALVREVEKARGPFKVSRPAEEVAVAVLAAPNDWLEHTVAEAIASRERLAEQLREMGLEPLSSAGNFLLVPMPLIASRVASQLRARGIAVRTFRALPSVGDAIRITVAPWPLLERFLEALREVLAALGREVQR
jgi:histidinol-phosphate aminotransferase